jgi:hypothetical protein
VTVLELTEGLELGEGGIKVFEGIYWTSIEQRLHKELWGRLLDMRRF